MEKAPLLLAVELRALNEIEQLLARMNARLAVDVAYVRLRRAQGYGQSLLDVLGVSSLGHEHQHFELPF